MDFFEAVTKRESCRHFDPRPIPKDDLIRIMEAARLAPSACNSQPWHFTVVTGQKLAEAVKCTQDLGMNRFTNDCSALVVINEEKATLSAVVGGKFKNQHFASYDIGIVAAHICYAALDLGISSCILGWFDAERLSRLLDLGNKRICLIIALGYAAVDTLRPKKRKNLSDIITFIE